MKRDMKNTDINAIILSALTSEPVLDTLQDFISDLGLEIENVISL